MSYSKLTSAGQDLIYRFAPPQTDLDRTGRKTPIEERQNGPKFPEDLNQFTSSVYYYWWEFLRLNEDYVAFCAKPGLLRDAIVRAEHLGELYRDFGDVRDADPKLSAEANFEIWWKRRGWVLFVEPDLQPDIMIQAEPFRETNARGDRIYISMQKDIDPEKIIKEINAYLKETRRGQASERRKHSQALYQPRHHKLNALAKYLTTKKAQLKYLKETGVKPSNAELADLAGLDYIGKNEPLLDPNGNVMKPDAQRKAGAEAINAADNIINYVAYGMFPVTIGDPKFDQRSDVEKCAALPKLSSYMRFSDKWLRSLGRSTGSIEDLPHWRKDIVIDRFEKR